MRKLETSDPSTWKALDDVDFCVTKSSIPFCSIGPDRGIEQENRTMKVIGGITGITQKEATLDKCFLIAPELARLVNEFGWRQYQTRAQQSTMTSFELPETGLFRNAEPEDQWSYKRSPDICILFQHYFSNLRPQASCL